MSGDPEAILGRADQVVEGVYSTGHQEHIYIECQAITARFDTAGRLEISGTMQCPYYVHRSLCHALGLADDDVRVRASAVGGGFGGKEDYPSMIAVHAALLARATGRPVRLAYDRHEDIIGTTKRHPALVRHRTAVDAEGVLLAMDIDVVLDGGAYTTLSPVVLSRAVLHAAGPYRCAHVRVRGKAVRTNTAANGAFRGFGAPQSQFAIERHMDRVARRVGLDPFEVRWRNALREGDVLPTGQQLDASTAALECLERVAEKTDFRRRWKASEESRGGAADGEKAHGFGISLFFHGAGFTGNGEH
ncbi:MAG: molybdopterin-dependent oxidoreductase, partial [Acidobacteriota bacterium]|nr:molybdopterin-dependent oxidoreductase [Acidobacteriota bacterium]